MRYIHLDNEHMPQSATGIRAPMQAPMDWHESLPHLFVRSPRSLAERDTFRCLRLDFPGSDRPQGVYDAKTYHFLRYGRF